MLLPPPEPLVPGAPAGPAGSTVELNVIGMLLLVVVRWLVRCWLLDVPEVAEPVLLRLPETEPEDELELEVEPELEVLSCASARTACSASAVMASAAKLSMDFMGLVLTELKGSFARRRPRPRAALTPDRLRRLREAG